VLSHYVEERHATELLAGDTRRTGYLLKDRVADVAEFTSSLRRVAAGGTALDPEVVRQLLARGRVRVSRGEVSHGRFGPGPASPGPPAELRWSPSALPVEDLLPQDVRMAAVLGEFAQYVQVHPAHRERATPVAVDPVVQTQG
jgi:hypothetical protein